MLTYRRVRGDMVQCYNILHGTYDPLPLHPYLSCIDTVFYARGFTGRS